jgi:hypothetical protein
MKLTIGNLAGNFSRKFKVLQLTFQVVCKNIQATLDKQDSCLPQTVKGNCKNFLHGGIPAAIMQVAVVL